MIESISPAKQFKVNDILNDVKFKKASTQDLTASKTKQNFVMGELCQPIKEQYIRFHTPSRKLREESIVELNMRLTNIIELDISLINRNPSLKSIDLRNNKIEILPDEVGSLANLNKLCVDNNFLKELPNSISKLKHLKILSAGNNRLTELPKEVCEIGGSLIQLILNDN